MKSGSISPGWSDNNSKTKSPVWDEPEWMSDFVKRKIIWYNYFRY